ncbi:magnesium transporter [Corynebacterium hindlerae]|uniref:magnesium transporter n=1 Tax=Corynebacterium hindlerae TaxID=699041 RepID=UPI001AD6CE50|nr:magnesium transporter [Corynebacterium hindlerae]QTH59953.1 magnesium transporter [Corynebacterium hindlerae]
MSNSKISAARRFYPRGSSSEDTPILYDVYLAFQNGDSALLRELLGIYTPHSIDAAICQLPGRTDYRILAQLDAHELASFLNDLPTPRQLAYIEALEDDIVSSALSEMAPDEANDLLQAVDQDRARQLRARLRKDVLREIELVAGYRENQLGALVNPAFLVVGPEATIGDVVQLMRVTSEVRFDTDTVFVCDPTGLPLGAVELAEVVRHMDSQQQISSFMDTALPSVCATDPVGEGLKAQQASRLSLLPVRNSDGQLLGVVSHRDLLDADSRLQAGILTRFGGSLLDSNLDYFASPLHTLFFTRVFWLLILTVFGVVTSTFVASQEDLIAEVIILAAFIAPIIDMGGNSGSQSATLVLRSMALGQITVSWKQLAKIVAREIPVAIFIAITVAVAEIVMALMSKSGPIFALGTETGVAILVVVGLSMFCCTVAGAVIGSLLPFLARRIGADPATLSAPLITSIMDIVGVLIYFGFAAVFLAGLL